MELSKFDSSCVKPIQVTAGYCSNTPEKLPARHYAYPSPTMIGITSADHACGDGNKARRGGAWFPSREY